MQKAYKYGVELELFVDRSNYDEVIAKAITAKFEHCSDSSINTSGGNYGIEFKTMVPMSFSTLEDSVKKLSRILTAYDAGVNTSCGFHVHISNKRFFNRKMIERITKMWVAIEDVMFSTQPSSRFGNQYCKRNLREFVTQEQIKLPQQKAQLIEAMRDKDRYYALNFNALRKHGTIECRLHSGTIDSKKILEWTKVLTAFFDYCLTAYDSKVVQELFDTPISDEKINKVLELLKLSDATKAHFLERVKKFHYDSLKRQQESASQAMKLKPQLDKARKAYRRASDTYSTAQRDLDRVLSVF